MAKETAKHAVVRTDNMAGTDVRSQLVSVKYMGSSGDTATEIDNGHVVKLDGLIEGEREIYKAKDVAVGDSVDDIVLLAAPEVMYDANLRSLDDYYNEAGKPIRGYHLHHGDTFSVTKEALDNGENPAVNDVIELAVGTKLKHVKSATSGSTTIGKIIATEVVGKYTFYTILVDPKAAASN